ncbi:MAG: DNA primase small subunit PriS [Candidatus Bathyarchaeota archaeon BA1]|nr:MAG: DNA primase small subunit PriS [Candidatus Bathyarchaeota archaeon BA1]
MSKIETKTFVQDKFAEYYRGHASTIQPPTSIEKREFGFLLFKERIMLRHKRFRSANDLREFLETTVPSDAYYSSAFYESPEREMEEKGWLGADLIFDIDADHILTPCAKIHDTWGCDHCGFVGKGAPPEKCPACGEHRFDEKTWPCEVCLESAKAETIKLMDLLISDFGLSSQEMRVCFSGHRGYHLHVESEEIRSLDQMARKEMVDYVVGMGLETRFHGLEERMTGRKSRILAGPDLNDPGWRGRIARGTYEHLLRATPQELEKIGLKKRVVDIITQRKGAILKSWKDTGPWGVVRGIGIESWRKIAQYGIERQSVKIDTVVTTDIHRLIRLTNTLHGKTGLMKAEVPIADIEHFDPLKSAIAFREGTIKVLVSEAPKFRLGDEIHGPYKEREVELPTAAALLLLCKEAARVVE